VSLHGADGSAADVARSPDNCGNHALEISKSADPYTRPTTDKIRTRYKSAQIPSPGHERGSAR
jgi:hypothetical protein